MPASVQVVAQADSSLTVHVPLTAQHDPVCGQTFGAHDPPCIHVPVQLVSSVMLHAPELAQQNPAGGHGVGTQVAPTMNEPAHAAPLETTHTPDRSQHAPVSDTATVTIVGETNVERLTLSDSPHVPLANPSVVNVCAAAVWTSNRSVRVVRLDTVYRNRYTSIQFPPLPKYAAPIAGSSGAVKPVPGYVSGTPS